METHKFIINNHEYLFVNQFIDKRDGFNHATTLLRDGRELGTASVHYINRTWERYTYQTVMRSCVNQLFTSLSNETIQDYKDMHNKKRLCHAKQLEIIESVRQFEGQDLVELMKQL